VEVHPEEVERIVAALRAVRLLPRAGSTTDTRAAGPELADALVTTEDTWSTELTTQDAALTALADFLVAALDSFTAVDTSLAEAAGGGS